MSLSLRDQLLKAGLVNEKQAKQAGKQKQKQQRLEKKGQIEVDDSQQQAALQAKAEKVARDQELNRQQQEKAEQKARAAQKSDAPLLRDYAVRFWADYARHWKPSTRNRNEKAIFKEILGAFGERRIDALHGAGIIARLRRLSKASSLYRMAVS